MYEYGFTYGPVTSVTFNADATGGQSNVLVNVGNRLIPNDSLRNVDVVSPAGFMSIPYNNKYAVVGILGGIQKPAVFGYIANEVNQPTTGELEPGEAAVYNNKYSVLVKLNEVVCVLNNALGLNTATMLYGENIVKILVDVINSLTGLIGTELATIVNQLNNHEHNTPSGYTDSMTLSGTTLTAPTTPSDLTTDLSALNAGKCYINDTGELI